MTTEIIKLPDAPLALATFDPSILAGQVRASTIGMYKKAFSAYLAFAGSWAQVLEPSILARWVAALANAELSPNTINRMVSSVRTVMKSAAQQGFVSSELAQRFDAVRGVKVGAMKEKLKENARTKISAEDMRRRIAEPAPNTLVGKMHRAMLLVMASSGARISEVVTLKPAQIKQRIEKGKTGYVILVSGKTDIGLREVPLSREAFIAIMEWITARAQAGVASEYIFTGFSGRGGRGLRGEHITTEAAWQTVKRYAAQLHLPHVKPHDFRRFVGTTVAVKDPRQAQKALGHKSIDTTYKHYVLDEMEVELTEGLF
jgi:integrase